jgi:hypothetical protein
MSGIAVAERRAKVSQERSAMSPIGAAAGSPPPQVNAAPPPPPKKDRDGDYDNNRPDGDKQSSNPNLGNNVNIKA